MIMDKIGEFFSPNSSLKDNFLLLHRYCVTFANFNNKIRNLENINHIYLERTQANIDWIVNQKNKEIVNRLNKQMRIFL